MISRLKWQRNDLRRKAVLPIKLHMQMELRWESEPSLGTKWQGPWRTSCNLSNIFTDSEEPFSATQHANQLKIHKTTFYTPNHQILAGPRLFGFREWPPLNRWGETTRGRQIYIQHGKLISTLAFLKKAPLPNWILSLWTRNFAKQQVTMLRWLSPNFHTST